MTAQQMIDLLQLVPLPAEGGFFRETYRSTIIKDDRSLSTAIYYLLTPATVSVFHRLKSDEVWHFYQGDTVELVMLHVNGGVELVRLGTRFDQAERCQVVVPAGSWQGANLANGGTWALMGCTVAPGFEFADFDLGQREQLTSQFPSAAAWIEVLS